MGRLLADNASGAGRLRQALAAPGLVLAPGAYDALSARLVEAAGFPVVYMTGFGTAASLLGRPDVGLLGLSEMVDNARRIVAAVDLPVVADADTGYGNPINVIRTVQEHQRAGVAGIHLEDQVAPKRCGHVSDKQVVPVQEMEAKLRAAVAARSDPDFVIIARTDARAPEGLEAAIERAGRYAAAGADMLFVEAPESDEEVEAVATALSGFPLVFNWAEGGRTPPVDADTLATLGFKMVIFPVGALLAAVGGIRSLLEETRRSGTPQAVLGSLPSFREFLDFIGLPEVNALEQDYRTEA